jgi:hypothetical protein
MSGCGKFRLLKQGYESALREEALYQSGGGASFQQAIQYESEAIRATPPTLCSGASTLGASRVGHISNAFA